VHWTRLATSYSLTGTTTFDLTTDINGQIVATSTATVRLPAGGIAGVKFNDHNGNGVRDTGDAGLGGWHILVNGVDRATTDANGNWSVTNIGPGTYTVQEVQQAGWTQTAGQAGFSFTASSGTNVTGINFGNFQNINLSGAKFNDHNANGIRDTGD